MTVLTFDHVGIKTGGYWSTPFHRWQGALAESKPIELAAECGRMAADDGRIDLESIDEVHLGVTVPSPAIFYGAPRLALLLGAPDGASGPTISQACATSAAVLASAGSVIELGDVRSALAVCADRTSNGPHLYYPSSNAAGGKGASEDWVWDNFTDPDHGHQMITSAENIAAEGGYDRHQQDQMSVLRHEQYQQALSDDREFHRAYQIEPLLDSALVGDQGVRTVDESTVAGRRTVMADGTVTSLSQTYPADGNAGLQLVSSRDADGVDIRLCGFSTERVRPAYMGQAPVPAAQSLLSSLGLSIGDMTAIKTHNPFAVNDIYFCEQLGLEWDAVNNYGSSLVWGHPQGPTGLRLVIELIEELRRLGGGYGLFSGCAAGDSASAIVVHVGDE